MLARAGAQRPGERENATVTFVVAISASAGRKMAEVGFLLILISGIWLAIAQLQLERLKLARFRTIVAGIALAVAGALLIVATHWGHFG